MQRFKRVATRDEAEPDAPRRPYQRHLMLLHTAQETLLLLLLGVSSNVFAYGMDKSIELLVATRARAAQEAGGFLSSYLIWSGSALMLCALSAACVQHISTAAVGSGIPQMKCVLAGGARIDDYLSARTLAAKVLSLVLAIGGGLAVGKEGPYVHISTCVAQQLCRLPLFRRLNETESLRRQMLAAGCAAGVAATFGAPVGGVLFSIEVTATLLCNSVAHLWRAFILSRTPSLTLSLTR
jgi:chloride channel 2